MTAVAYHELRNPLNGTVGYLRLLETALADTGARTAEARAKEATVHLRDARTCCESALNNLRALTYLYKSEATQMAPTLAALDLRTVLDDAATAPLDDSPPAPRRPMRGR